jgi:hypothetical protein
METPEAVPMEAEPYQTEAPVFEEEEQLVFGFHSFPSTMNVC